MRDQGGYSLIQMVLALAILGILSVIVIPTLVDMRTRARDSRRISDIANFIRVMEVYRGNNPDYAGEGDSSGTHLSPKCSNDIKDDLSGEAYLPKMISDPLDSKTACNDNNDDSFFYGWDSTHIGGREWCVSINRLETDWGRNKLLETYGAMKAVSVGCDANICDAEFNYCFK